MFLSSAKFCKILPKEASHLNMCKIQNKQTRCCAKHSSLKVRKAIFRIEKLSKRTVFFEMLDECCYKAKTYLTFQFCWHKLVSAGA